MREYTIKITIAVIALYILFKFTVGSVINTYVTKVKLLTDHSQRTEIKEKILQEMKKGNEKENFFNNEDKIIISNFLNKIIDELDLKANK